MKLKLLKLSHTLQRLNLHKENLQVKNLLDYRINKIASNPQELVRKIFEKREDGYYIRSSLVSQRIKTIDNLLGAFLMENGRGDVTIASNGASRSIEDSISGSSSKASGSLHGLALAHDLLINSPKSGKYTGLSVNLKILNKDPELVLLMHEFAIKENLDWGGLWEGRGTAFSIDGNTYWSEELHHFELWPDEIPSNVSPLVIQYMNIYNMSPSDLIDKERRIILYNHICNDLY